MNRRTLLKFGVAGTALLAVGGVGVSLQSSAPAPQPVDGLRVLSDQEHAALHAIAEALLPGTRGFPTAAEIGVATKVDTALSHMHPSDVFEIKMIIRMMENGLFNFVFNRNLRPLSRQTVEVRQSILDSWRIGKPWPTRAMFKSIHDLCAASYYTDPRVFPHIGYPGPPDFRALEVVRP